MNLKELDAYRQWIISMRPTCNGWKAEVYPKHVFEAFTIERLVKDISIHVVNEVVELIADAFDVKEQILSFHGKRPVTDARMIAASILYTKFPITHQMVANSLCWKSHSSSIGAQNMVNYIPELIEKKNKILKIYPFLNGNKEPLTW